MNAIEILQSIRGSISTVLTAVKDLERDMSQAETVRQAGEMPMPPMKETDESILRYDIGQKEMGQPTVREATRKLLDAVTVLKEPVICGHLPYRLHAHAERVNSVIKRAAALEEAIRMEGLLRHDPKLAVDRYEKQLKAAKQRIKDLPVEHGTVPTWDGIPVDEFEPMEMMRLITWLQQQNIRKG